MESKEEEYREMFLAEAQENYEELNNLFTNLEKNTADKKAIDAIFRITHTLKGNAMGMGFEEIADLGHVMEDIFSEVKEGHIVLDNELFNSLFKANDKLGELIEALKTGEKVNYKGIRTKLSVFLKNAKDEQKKEEIIKVIDQKKEEIYLENHDKTPLFERIGGYSTIDKALDIFYDKVLNDELLKPFFEGIGFDMKKQIAKQRAFLSYALGGPVSYTGKDMRTAHAHLVVDGLNESHVTIFTNHLTQTLKELNIAQELINEVEAIVSSMKNDVLGISNNHSVNDKKTVVLENPEIEPFDEVETTENEEDEDDKPKITFSDLVQVPVRKLDDLMNLVGELIIERDSLIAKSVDQGGGSSNFARLQRITSDLQYGVMDVRLIQIGFLFKKFNRIIRDVAAIEKKEVDLKLEGTEIEIDRNILKIMSDSLVHLVRNSVSHGIEKEQIRIATGKPKAGMVTLKARNEKDTVIIEVSDDGHGIDHHVIAKKAVEKGIITKEYAARASKDELLMLIFEPGFSNAAQITEVSGRGVGMDVVKKATESIGGKIDVVTKIGEGTTIRLSLPSSMAVKGALLFELNKQTYAVALSYTEAVISLTKNSIHKVSNGLMANYLGKTISIIFLNDLYEISGLADLTNEGSLHNTYDNLSSDDKLDVLVASYGNKYVGFVVDKLLQQKEIVEKTLQNPIDKVEIISGATILGDGNICLVLDIANIINTMYREKNLI